MSDVLESDELEVEHQEVPSELHNMKLVLVHFMALMEGNPPKP